MGHSTIALCPVAARGSELTDPHPEHLALSQHFAEKHGKKEEAKKKWVSQQRPRKSVAEGEKRIQQPVGLLHAERSHFDLLKTCMGDKSCSKLNNGKKEELRCGVTGE